MMVKREDTEVGTADNELLVSERIIRDRESLSENCSDEIDAWAKRALAANGFGDY